MCMTTEGRYEGDPCGATQLLILTVVMVTSPHLDLDCGDSLCDFVSRALIMYYGYIRCNRGVKLTKRYTGALCITFATFSKFILFLNKKGFFGLFCFKLLKVRVQTTWDQGPYWYLGVLSLAPKQWLILSSCLINIGELHEYFCNRVLFLFSKDRDYKWWTSRNTRTTWWTTHGYFQRWDRDGNSPLWEEVRKGRPYEQCRNTQKKGVSFFFSFPPPSFQKRISFTLKTF